MNLTKEQAESILKRAKVYTDNGNMRDAMLSVLSDFNMYGVGGGGMLDILILGDSKNYEELKKACEGYCFWPR